MAKPTDRVQLQKRESAAGGGDPADDSDFLYEPLESAEDCPEVRGHFYQPAVGPKDESVAVYRDGNNLVFEDVNQAAITLTALAATAGGGITEPQHHGVDQLVHNIAETSFDEFAYQNPDKKKRVIRHTVWDSISMSVKVRETLVTYGSDKLKKKPIEVVTIQFDASGTEAERVTETVTYSDGKKIDTISRVLS